MPQDNQGTENQEQKPGVDLSQMQVQDEFGNPVSTQGQEGQDTQTARPEGLPEGFDSWEDLAAKYKELAGEEGGEDEGQEDDESTTEGDEDEAQGNDQDDQETPEQKRIKALETQLHDREIYDMVGGKEAYEEMSQWAGQNLPEEEVALLNDVWESSDLNAKKFAAKALRAMYQDINGAEGKRISGQTAPGVTPITSDGELQEAMRDPRYRRRDSIGETYRNEVDKRLQAGIGRNPKQPGMDGWVSF